MNRSSISSLFGFIIFIGIVSSIFFDGSDIFNFGSILPYIIGFSILSSILRGFRKNQSKQSDSEVRSNSTVFTREWNVTPKKKNKCEYCGEFNDSEREYCENCGAKQLPY